MSKYTREIIEKLAGISKKQIPKRDPEQEKMYNTLKDTFNAFDRDGSAELGYPEYVEAWRFLGQPGDDKVIKNAFDAVDVDGSGLMDWIEFAFSIMGENAIKY